ncbi:hypothetical protein [Bacillus sp. UNC438CL73TsuS30]|uniref:hypothetical protein n=1 Tax=Bacillus sp. UNC438CL73TsuS30 TaxID=1340434 RepID=UPI00047D18B3|nr:hypothetical protein [Bacillus sp. UNC438CL73TsuS30]
MKVSQEIYKEIDRLYDQYEREVKEAKRMGLLTDSTARTYLLHSSNFLKWCRNDFQPGGRNK